LKKKIVKKLGCSNFNYKKFNITIDLDKKQNPVSSYTLKLGNGERIILTGGNIVREFYLLTFNKVK